MAVKSIIDVDVNDEAFQRFNQTFTKYQDALKKMPEAWGATGAKIQQSGSEFLRMTAALMAQAELLKRAETSHDHIRGSVEQIHRHWTGIAGSVTEFASKIERTTITLLRWAGLGAMFTGLIGGAAGLWGIDRMAHGITSDYRAAQGFRIPSGTMGAMGVTYGQLVDVPSMLGRIMEIQNSVGKAPFVAMGLRDTNNKDTAALAIEAMTKAGEIYRQNPNAPDVMLQSRGILPGMLGPGVFGSREELNRWVSNSPAQLAQLQKEMQLRSMPVDQGGLALSELSQHGWADFTKQLTDAGLKIRNIFGEGLDSLSKPLGDVSTGLVDVVRSLALSTVVKTWLTDLGGGLEHLANWIKSDDFKRDLNEFIAIVGRMGNAVESFGKRILDSDFNIKGFIDNVATVTAGLASLMTGIDAFLKPLNPGGLAQAIIDTIKSAFSFHLSDLFGSGSSGSKPLSDALKTPGYFGGGADGRSAWQRVLPGWLGGKAGPTASSSEIVSKLTAMGLSPGEAAAFAGAMQVESGLNPTARNPNGGAFGLNQLMGSRQASLMSGRFGDPNTVDAQLKAMMAELHTSEAQTLFDLRAAEARGASQEELADIIMKEFHRPSAAEQAQTRVKRETYAKRYVPQAVPKVVIENRTPGTVTAAGTIGQE